MYLYNTQRMIPILLFVACVLLIMIYLRLGKVKQHGWIMYTQVASICLGGVLLLFLLKTGDDYVDQYYQQEINTLYNQQNVYFDTYVCAAKFGIAMDTVNINGEMAFTEDQKVVCRADQSTRDLQINQLSNEQLFVKSFYQIAVVCILLLIHLFWRHRLARTVKK